MSFNERLMAVAAGSSSVAEKLDKLADLQGLAATAEDRESIADCLQELAAELRLQLQPQQLLAAFKECRGAVYSRPNSSTLVSAELMAKLVNELIVGP